MTKLLTIAIPTFNRAKLLDKQLTWLAQAIKGFESVCEVLVSDNCSTDETPIVIEKWKTTFNNTTFYSKRNHENIGAVRNIASCIKNGKGKYVWVISDDDIVFDNSVAYVIHTINQHPNLGLIILNFSKSDAKTGHIFEQHCFQVENDEFNSQGKVVFERCLKESVGGVGLTTALVCRTDLVKRAVDTWASGLSNMAVQIYWAAFCAYHSSALVTKHNYLECVSGTHYFMQNPRLLVTLEYADIPEVMLKLREIGYSNSLSRKIVLSNLKKFNLKVLLGALRRWPITTIKATFRYVIYAYSSALASSSNSLSKSS